MSEAAAANAAPITGTSRICLPQCAHGSHFLSVWMHAPDSFSFHVFADQNTAPVFESAASYPNLMRAKIAAERWIDGLDERNENIVFVLARQQVGGWDLAVVEDTRGTFGVSVIDHVTSEEAAKEFAGYLDRDLAMEEASAWARANPCDGPAPPIEAGDLNPVTNEHDEAVPAFIHDDDDGPEENEGPAAPSTSRVDEVWTLLAQRKDLRAKRAAAMAWCEQAKAQVKALTAEIEGVDGQLEDAHQDAPRQRTLPLAPAPAVEGMSGFERWAYNGVDHVILVRQLGPDSWAAALHGHQEQTEGFAEQRAAAIEACKGRAAIVFEDTDPGSVEVKAPPKRRGKAKAAAGPTHVEVVAALEASMTLAEAAERLGAPIAVFEEWAITNDTSLSKFLAASTGEDAPKTSKRSSRRSKGAK